MQFISLFTTDIITNSSSVTYTYANGSQKLYDLLNAVMQAIGAEGKAEDFFDVLVVPENWNDVLDYLENHPGEMSLPHPIEDLMYTGKLYAERDQILLQHLKHLKEDAGWEFNLDNSDNDWSGYNSFETKYVVLAKDGIPTEIGKFLDLFDTASFYNG